MADLIETVPARIGAKLEAIPKAVRPVAVLAYRCPHSGCRKGALVGLGTAAKHAERCIHNPARRTCATCKHDDKRDFGCAMDALPDTVKCASNCDSWEALHA